MSRRAQVVRSAFIAGPMEALQQEPEVFMWNASYRGASYYDITTTFGSSNQFRMYGETPIHASLGADVDFIYTDEGLSVRVPVDGVYSASARVMAFRQGDAPAEDASVWAELHSTWGEIGTLDEDFSYLQPEPTSGRVLASAGLSNAGFPLREGDEVYVFHSAYPGTGTLSTSLWHLSVTYEAPLGTVYFIGGG